jgi:hypothetical protein
MKTCAVVRGSGSKPDPDILTDAETREAIFQGRRSWVVVSLSDVADLVHTASVYIDCCPFEVGEILVGDGVAFPAGVAIVSLRAPS